MTSPVIPNLISPGEAPFQQLRFRMGEGIQKCKMHMSCSFHSEGIEPFGNSSVEAVLWVTTRKLDAGRIRFSVRVDSLEVEGAPRSVFETDFQTKFEAEVDELGVGHFSNTPGVLEQLVPRFPTEALGPGAKWSLSRVPGHNSVWEFEGIVDEIVHLRWQDSLTLEGTKIRGEGHAFIDLTRPIPVSFLYRVDQPLMDGLILTTIVILEHEDVPEA